MAKKVFYDFVSAMRHAQSIMDKANPTFVGHVAEQVYKDSEEYTYLDTHDMYKSGQLYSQFNKGLIIERTPYVRRRYYEGGTPGKENLKARPKWFEATYNEHKEEYKKMYNKAIEMAKKEV